MLRSPDQKKKKERGKRTTPLFHNIKSLTAKTNKPKKKKKKPRKRKKSTIMLLSLKWKISLAIYLSQTLYYPTEMNISKWMKE